MYALNFVSNLLPSSFVLHLKAKRLVERNAIQYPGIFYHFLHKNPPPFKSTCRIFCWRCSIACSIQPYNNIFSCKGLKELISISFFASSSLGLYQKKRLMYKAFQILNSLCALTKIANKIHLGAHKLFLKKRQNKIFSKFK